MQTYELYRKYRERLEALWLAIQAREDRNTALVSLMREFQAEASKLEPRQAQQLCEELCDQLEYEAAHSVNPERRTVMLHAAKIIELMPASLRGKE
ncbi:MAG TPA: hypothetical protein VM659_10390 [Dongiaceae bacterium]|nr:hypothetical protein [Dongiaceae bacterium]